MTNSVEMVRQAERKSETIVAGANSEANQIIDKAKKAADTIITDGVKASRDRIADSVTAAHQTNRTLMDKFSVEIDAEIESLKDLTKDRTAEAVERVYQALG